MSEIELIATSVFGLEALVARELRELGYDKLVVENGRVIFTAETEAVCRTNLWLRTAERVLIKVGSFKATTFDQLFEQTKALPWDQWLPENANFPVEGKSIDSQLHSVPDCQSIVKKAIVEKLKLKYKCNWFAEDGPRYTIEVGLLKDQATLTIDTTGPGLHKRGYRKLVSQAPLKETLAAALIILSHWHPDRVLLDPCCGSGTIPIEAALIGQRIAPGLNRSFIAEGWPDLPPLLWQDAREEARSQILRDQELRIYGADLDPNVLSLARYHVQQAGVEQIVHLQKLPLSETRSRFQYGYLISNPPYGERMGEVSEAEQLYKDLCQVAKQLETWSFYIITPHPRFEQIFGRKADKNRKLYNGRIQCYYYQYFGPKPARAKTGQIGAPIESK